MEFSTHLPLSSRQFRVFNHPRIFIEGWYWALPSQQLKVGQVKAVQLQGRNLAMFRGRDGQVRAIAAYCPHMGAHLAEGTVDDNTIRCFFHNWSFDAEGRCVDAPCLEHPPAIRQPVFPAAERYGIIWVWTGTTPKYPPPFVPELGERECDIALGDRFVKHCHPNVVMINAIDAHHFNTVHNLPVKIVFDAKIRHDNAITFSNTTRGGDASAFVRLIRPFYQNEITYRMCYWYGSTGTVTLGPDLLHFYIMFALRMIDGGKTEGQTILITPKRLGLHGWMCNRVILWLTRSVGNYFAKGDTRIFQTIRFDLKTPTIADRSILQFADHVEQQKALVWGSWEDVGAMKESKYEGVKDKG
jgi:phenylpropionate dioxygenase-like ring-hydroxylating dioxygenase large terminal subunit